MKRTMWTRWTMWAVCIALVMICSGGWAQQVLAKNFTATWSSVTPSTATITLNASGEMKSLLLKVPYCDSARVKIVDSRSGYVYVNQDLTPGVNVGLFNSQRVVLTGEQYGVVYCYLWMDPASAKSVTITGQYLYRK